LSALRLAPTRAATPTTVTFALPRSVTLATRTPASGRVAGCAFSTASAPSGWHVRLWRANRPRHTPAAPARTRLRRRSLRLRRRSGSASSFDTRFTQGGMTESARIFLRVDCHPNLLTGRGMLQQQVAALSGSDLNKSRGLELRAGRQRSLRVGRAVDWRRPCAALE
jgi:hypothetical protein